MVGIQSWMSWVRLYGRVKLKSNEDNPGNEEWL